MAASGTRLQSPSLYAFVLLGLMMAAAGLATTAGRAMGGETAGADANLRTIAIIGLESENVPSQFGSRAVDSLKTYLEQTGEFSVTDSQDVRNAIDAIVPASDPGWFSDEVPSAILVGRELRVGTVAIGSISLFGRLLTISVTIVNAYSGEVVADLEVESFKGKDGMPEAVRQLTEQLLDLKDELPSADHGLFPEEMRQARLRRSRLYETSFALLFGSVLTGQSSTGIFWKGTYREHTAHLRWLVDITLSARLTNSRWIFGLTGGASSIKTSWVIPGYEYTEQEDSGIAFHLGPRVGYTLFESRGIRLTPFAGAGYRNFSDESKVDNLFASTGFAMRIFVLRCDIAYCRGFDSDSLLHELITLNVGLGLGW